jgi:hypothetical protein
MRIEVANRVCWPILHQLAIAIQELHEKKIWGYLPQQPESCVTRTGGRKWDCSI